ASVLFDSEVRYEVAANACELRDRDTSASGIFVADGRFRRARRCDADVRLAQAKPRRHRHQGGERRGSHLAHHVAAVRLDGDLADAKLITYLLVQQTRYDQSHHFLLAAAERCMALAQRLQLGLLKERGTTALDRVANSIQQNVVAERLGKELDRSLLHRLDAGRHVAVARNEDDRHVGPIGGHALLQVETVEVWQRKIENEAARRGDPPMREEFLRGGENLDLPAGEANQRLERLAYRDIIIDDEHDWRRVWHD